MTDVPVPDCSCDGCTSACRYHAGWFLPGEAEKLADFLGEPLERVFATRLAVDYYHDNGEPIFVLSPGTVGQEPGKEFPYDPRGRCVFLSDAGRCSVHAVKPYECRRLYHTDSREEIDRRHQAIADAWREHQGQIRALLGHEPEAAEPDVEDFLRLLTGF